LGDTGVYDVIMTSTTNTAKLDRMVLDFKKARLAAATSRLGSTKERNAQAKMERLVAEAAKMGLLKEFVRTVNTSTVTL
jgi:cobalamin biosynthesis protein CbiD